MKCAAAGISRPWSHWCLCRGRDGLGTLEWAGHPWTCSGRLMSWGLSLFLSCLPHHCCYELFSYSTEGAREQRQQTHFLGYSDLLISCEALFALWVNKLAKGEGIVQLCRTGLFDTLHLWNSCRRGATVICIPQGQVHKNRILPSPW